jgi:site-specific recombinase XerD
MFATEAATGCLPVHIAAKILGHANINTTQSYTAGSASGLPATRV